jgi:hypothetical protein
MDNVLQFREYPGFGARIVSAENAARYAAMLAGDEWIGTFQYGNARNAYDQIHDATGDQEAALKAANLYVHVQELPPAGTWCDDPEPEKAWYAACELFAFAANTTVDDADVRLRGDFKYYLEIEVSLIRTWRETCEAGEPQERAMPFNLWRHLTSFMAAECGVDTDRYTNYLKDSHHRSCSCGKRP